ncbi:MAG: ACT domain-containing protein [Candidatus Micrarchaeota archaeon]
MVPESDLETLIRGMKPSLKDGHYYFAPVEESRLMELANHLDGILGIFREEEGLTVIFSEEILDDMKELSEASPSGPFSLITLTINSDLMAVGFLAKLTAALAEEKIPVNAVSAYFHDHLLVPSGKSERALAVLGRLASGGLE